ncbi:MAG: DivIVA domain-containing protein [Huintestinicola sp.]
MITAKDIKTRTFEQAKPGYNTEEVDRFLDEIADQITAMIAEKEDTEKKMEVLVESIRKYKSEEEAVKDAMISVHKQGRTIVSDAQAQADAIIAEAQQKAEAIISEANVKSDEIVGSTAARAKKERIALEEMQNAAKDFKRELLAMYKAHLELITSLPSDDEEEEEEMSEVQSETAEEAVEEEAAEAVSYDDMDDTKVIDISEITAE